MLNIISIKEMQMKIMRYHHFTPTRMAKIKKANNNRLAVAPKLNIELPYDPAVLLLGKYS